MLSSLLTGLALAAPFHAQWDVDDGLPVDGVSDVLVADDGLVWVATWDGLVRFDGARFEPVAPDAKWPSRRIIQVRQAPDGAVWAQTEAGALVRVDAHDDLRVFDVGRMGSATPMVLDPDGRWLIVTDRGLERVGLDGVTQLPLPDARALALGDDGAIWATTADGRLHRRVGDAFEPWALPAPIPGAGLLVPAPGGWWVGTGHGLWRVTGHDAAPLLHDGAPWDVEVRGIAPDGAGGLWVGTKDGLTHWRDGHAEALPDDARTPRLGSSAVDAGGHRWVAGGHVILRDGEVVGRVDGARIADLAIDAAGTAWVATAVGLHRYVPGRIDVVADGLAEPSTYAVGVDADGAWWVGTTAAGVDRIGPDGARHFGEAEGLDANVHAVLATRDGGLWLGTTQRGVYRRDGDRFVWAGGPERAVSALAQRADGVIFAGGLDGLWTYDGAWRALPGAPTGIRAIAFDGDRVWLGTADRGVWRLDGDQFTAVDVGSQLVRWVLPDGRGGVWAATEDGGLRHDGGRVIGLADGLPARGAHTLVRGPDGAFWGSTNRGLFRIADLDAPKVAVFAEPDGLPNPEANGGTGHAALVLRDRVLFATQAGIAVVDPARVAAGSLTPAVIAPAIVVGGARRSIAGAVVLDADERSFGLDLAVLGLRDPDRARVRWRLDGADAAWVDAGDRRTAWYTDVHPGTWTFTAEAVAADGTPSAPITLTVTVAPYFWETWPFRAAVAVGLAGLVAGAVWMRIAALRQRQVELEALVAARTAALAEEKAALEVAEQTVRAQAARLAEVDRLKTRYFANLSHELRTPLTLVLGPLEDVREGRRGAVAPAAQEAVARAERSAKGLFELVNQLLDVVKIDAGQLTLKREPFDLAALIRAAVAEFAPLAERQGLRLVDAVPGGVVAAEVDARELRKVVGNLLSNAIKFTPRGGEVHVLLTEADGQAALTVRDTGVGISPEGLQRIFDRFWSADGGVTGLQPGTGLGLALTREIVELHGGQLTVTSAPGAGTTFTVTLATTDRAVVDGPVPEVHVPDLAILGPASAPPPDERPTVLVVDDHADLRRYIAEALSPRYRVVEAADGLEALGTARRELPDLVVSDVMMPGMDGNDLVRALRADPDFGGVPILLLSARGSAEAQIEGLQRGADAYLVKPFSSAVLRAQIDGLIAQRARVQAPAPEPAEDLSVDARYERAIRELIAERHVDPEFGVQELADAMHQDRAHLFRRVKALTGQAPSDLLRLARLEHAARLLAQRAGNVSEVAYASGFASLSYFSQAFREHFGVAPSKYAGKADERG